MRSKEKYMIVVIGLFMVLFMTSVAAEGQAMEKFDPDDDVVKMGSPSAQADEISKDLEILSASIDWSGDVVMCEFRVKGEVVATSSDSSTNIYNFNIDLTPENNEEEIFFTFSTTGLSGGSVETGVISLYEDDYSSSEGTFSFEFDKTHFGSHTDVLDIEVRATNTNGWLDEIRWGEGFPGDDDDTSDDDTTDDDTADDDEDSPGFSLIILLASVIFTLIVIGFRRRRD